MMKCILNTIAISLFLMIIPSIIYSQNSDTNTDKDAIYFGIHLNYLNFNGECFDGLHYFISEEQIMLVPELQSTTGFGFIVGYKMAGGGIEFAFNTVSMAASFSDYESTADFNIISGRANVNIVDDYKITPYLIIGANYAWLNLENGSATIADPSVIGDVIYNGFGLETGIGITYNIINELAIYANGILHIEFYLFGGGIADETSIYLGWDNIMTGYNLDMNIGLMIRF